MAYVLCLASGILLSLAFPKADLHGVAWFAVAPLMYYACRLGLRQALIAGFAFGMGFNAGLLYWVGLFGALPVVLLCLIQSLFIIAFAAVTQMIGSRLRSWGRLALLPALWVSLEWLNSLGMTAFPWGSLGYSQYKVMPLIQISSLTGVWGVSFLLALSNALLANLFTAYRQRSGIGAVPVQVGLVLILVIGAWVYGLRTLSGLSPDRGAVRAAVIQGNIRQNVLQDAEYREHVWRVYGDLTRDAARRGAELAVWPEGVVPGCMGIDPVVQAQLKDLSAETGVSLLVGGRDEDQVGRRFNSAFLVTPERGIVGRYAKMHLVPFGEVVLARDYLPMLERYRVTEYDVSPGRRFVVMDGGWYRVGTAICFESIFPGISRRLVRSGADLLCVITNDSWFGRTSAARQHLAKAVFRAVETDRYVLRAAVTGESCITDPRGRILARSDLFERKVLLEEVHVMHGSSFYTKHGDWLPYLCIGVVLAMTVTAWHRAGTAGRRSRSAP